MLELVKRLLRSGSVRTLWQRYGRLHWTEAPGPVSEKATLESREEKLRVITITDMEGTFMELANREDLQ